MATRKHTTRAAKAHPAPSKRAKSSPKVWRTDHGRAFEVKGGMVEIGGQLLNREQFEAFKEAVRKHYCRSNELDPSWHRQEEAHRQAIHTVLDNSRPSAIAKERIREVGHEFSQIAMALTGLELFPFHRFTPNAKQHGCKLLLELAADAEQSVKRLRHFAESLTIEESQKLQELCEREEAYRRIGKGEPQ